MELHGGHGGAITAARRVLQRTELEVEEGGGGEEAETALPQRCLAKCSRGHVLQHLQVEEGRKEAAKCNGPCGRNLAVGQWVWACPGEDCDVDICERCAGGADRGDEGTPARCCRGHAMTFNQVARGTRLRTRRSACASRRQSTTQSSRTTVSR